MTLPSLRQAPLTWTLWLVSLVALARLGCSFWPARPLAARSGFAAAVDFLRTTQSSDSIIVVWPPVHGRSVRDLPPELVATDAVPIEPDAARHYLRVLVLGPRGFPRPPELASATAEPRRVLGELEVGVFTYPARDRQLFDLRAAIGEARVSVRGPELNLDCANPRPDRGWACAGRPNWNNVSPTSLRVERGDWPCVWAHPVSGHELLIDLGVRTLGDRVELEAALTDDAARTPGGAPVHLRLEVDGVGAKPIVRGNSPGILRDALTTPRGQRAGVRLVITTANDGRRHLGINLRLVESRGPAPEDEAASP